MRLADVFAAWGKVLRGGIPSLSIEITRECPLRCPGCYAYEPEHLGGGVTLRELRDYKGQELIDGVLAWADHIKPLHISLVGGDPLVRYREVEALVPLLLQRNIHVQIVTSAFRPLAKEWASMQRLNVVVSIDGLQAEHDARRAPATYERILKNIEGQHVTVHCTVTGQMMRRAGYLEDFLKFWSPRPEIKKFWFSLFTPQIGEVLPEVLTAEERARVIEELLDLRQRYRKIDMAEALIRKYGNPPASPEKCTFAQTTRTVSADLKTPVTPCQFGGQPDCSTCGCIASAGLEALTAHWWGGVVPVGAIYRTSLAIGRMVAKEAGDPPVRTALVQIEAGD